ncbi:MAG TPA: WD40 repeat domain-containing protein [Gemmataceae bacterium]|nr:WD40 repeat domain-containing protein [Gemmataceae bacterium]
MAYARLHCSFTVLVFLTLAYPSWSEDPQGAGKLEAIKEAKACTDLYGDPLPPGAVARLGTERFRPGSYVRFVACLPDGEAILTLDQENGFLTLVTIWELATGRVLQRFAGPPQRSGGSTVALSADGKMLVTMGYDSRTRKASVLLWDVASGKELPPLTDVGVNAMAIALAPDGKTLAVSTNIPGDFRLWDLTTRSEVRHFQETEDLWPQLAFSPDGRTLASGGMKGGVRLWDVATGRQLRAVRGHGEQLTSLTFSPDNKTLATATRTEKSIRLWDTATGKELRAFQGELGSACLAFSPDGRFLASGEEVGDDQGLKHHPVRLWDVATGREVRRFLGHLFGANVVAFSHDGSKLISGGIACPLRIYEVATGKVINAAEAHESHVNSVAFSPDGKTLATGGLDGAIRFWEARAGKPSRLFAEEHRDRVWQVAYSPDGRTLASASQDGTARFWDPSSGRETGRLPLMSAGLLSVAYTPDSLILAACATSGEITFWDAATHRKLDRPSKVKGNFGSRPFSPDGKMFAAIDLPSIQGSISIWDTVTGKRIHRWQLSSYMAVHPAFSPDGRMLATAVLTKALHFLDIPTHKDRSIVLSMDAPPTALQFSPDGRLLAIGTAGGTIILWEIASNQVRRRFSGHLSSVSSLTFSPDGSLLASGNYDTTTLLWDMTGRADMGSMRPRALSRQEVDILWSALASDDAAKAYQAMLALTISSEVALPLFKEKLRPVAGVGPQQLEQLIADLDSPHFALRQKATQELGKFRELARASLRRALEGQISLEMRRRLEELLSNIEPSVAAPELLQSLRAVEVLEQIGTPEVAQILQTLAQGAPESRLTAEAMATLARLTKRFDRSHSTERSRKPPR